MPADKSQAAKATTSDSDDAIDDTGVTADTSADVDAAADVPMNRAERRAKKKAGGKPQVVAKMEPKNVNSGPSPRQWANRRSG